MQRGPESTEGFDDSRRVLWGRTHPNIRVLGRTDMAVGGQRMSADQQELNLSVVEFC